MAVSLQIYRHSLQSEILSACAVWDIVYNESQVLQPYRKAIFSLLCIENGPAEANQEWHSAFCSENLVNTHQAGGLRCVLKGS